MRKLILEFDDKEIDQVMAEEAIKGFELPWVKRIIVDDGEFFPITSVSKDDVRGIYSDDKKELQKVEAILQKLGDDDMKEIASRMADAYCDEVYWIDLKIIFEELYYK